jgi:hypothetical protein
MNDKDLILKRLKSAISANGSARYYNEGDAERMYRFITENIEIVQVPE